MQFKKRFHEGLRSGAIAVSYRAWREPRVVEGSRYRVPPVGTIRIDRVTPVSLSSVSEADAQASGFESLEELKRDLQRTSSRRITRRSKVYRVAFHFAGELPAEPEREATPETIRETREKLDRMDRRSQMGPWTRVALSLIDDHPGTAARELSPSLERTLPEFKTDVRKLKRLGLTRSLETGYELTSLGQALVGRGGPPPDEAPDED